MEATCKLGEIEIFLPDASTSYFLINEDLADLFKLETNIEAVNLLRKKLRDKFERKIYRRIDFDYESSAAIIRTTDAELILKTAITIHELASAELPEEEIHSVQRELTAHKRPEKQKWKKGDVFSIQLENDTYAFGQVVWKSNSHPVCGLLDINKTDVPPLEEIINHPFISVLPLTPRSLDNHKWKVFGNMEVKIHMEDVLEKFNGTNAVGAKSFSDGVLDKLANAYYGVIPWNIFNEEDFFDQIILPDVARPADAIVLSSSEKELYQKKNSMH